MFENIIGHAQIIGQLKREILTDRLPSSILLEGMPYSGKNTLALELARVISCTGDRSWNCQCQSCRSQKLVTNPDTLMIGPDNFMEEIQFTGELMLHKNEKATRFMFIRAVRKLTRRFDPVFFDENETKFKKIQPVLEDIETQLEEIIPENDRYVPNEKKIEKTVQNCRTLLKEMNLATIPVNQLRKITFWSHTTTSESRKIVIIENAEKMNDSARNSLLKILEEPPENTFFILLTSRLGEIIPTIKSRLRIYDLKDRTPEEKRMVVQRVFRDTSGSCSSISEYIESFDPDIENINKLAVRFVSYFMAANKDPETKNYLKNEFKNIKSESLKIYFEKILSCASKLDKNTDMFKLEKLNMYLRQSWFNFESLNISSDNILSDLLFFAGGVV